MYSDAVDVLYRIATNFQWNESTKDRERMHLYNPSEGLIDVVRTLDSIKIVQESESGQIDLLGVVPGIKEIIVDMPRSYMLAASGHYGSWHWEALFANGDQLDKYSELVALVPESESLILVYRREYPTGDVKCCHHYKQLNTVRNPSS